MNWRISLQSSQLELEISVNNTIVRRQYKKNSSSCGNGRIYDETDKLYNIEEGYNE